jgi:hypothetical protein
MKAGDKFTIYGTGKGKSGAVVGGRSVKTGRYEKPLELTTFVVTDVSKAGPPEYLRIDDAGKHIHAGSC